MTIIEIIWFGPYELGLGRMNWPYELGCIRFFKITIKALTKTLCFCHTSRFNMTLQELTIISRGSMTK